MDIPDFCLHDRVFVLSLVTNLLDVHGVLQDRSLHDTGGEHGKSHAVVTLTSLDQYEITIKRVEDPADEPF